MRIKIFIALALLPLFLDAQDRPWPGQWFNGYAKTLKGGGFEYHSPQPGVTTSMLLRSIDSVQYIEWATDSVPASFNRGEAAFLWIFGIDANPESCHYRLYVNGRYCLTFANPVVSEKRSWKVTGEQGASLAFLPTMIDKYNDPMGYAVLTLPAGMLIKGRQQVIKVVGESKEKRTWYMTFEAGVEEKLTVVQEPALIRGNGMNMIPVIFRFVHPGEAQQGSIEIPGCPAVPFTLETGFTAVKVLLPESTPAGEHEATIRIGNGPFIKKNFTISPSRHFTIYLVQHTHTDIGYTRPQTEILPDHLRYIDYALDFCDLTDSLPDDARFRWTCETSWAVREYLRTRPAGQTERLKRRVKEGRIELTALFLNGSDLSDDATVASMLQPVREIREMGLPVTTAMQDDINGVPWALAEYLPGAGIRFLNMGQNDARALKPFDRPAAFWWESPSGKRILVNRPEHYMMGNSLGILSSNETFGQSLFRHLMDITDKGYPFDIYPIQFSGYLTDNSPPSTTACSLVDQWNKTYVWPKLRLATVSEFLHALESQHGDELPVYRGAWPDWWMDGFGSAALQTSYARQAHGEKIANNGLRSMAILLGAEENDHVKSLAEQISDDIAFYDEHTFGAAESITDPLCENSVVQLGEKESYVWSAVKKNRILREEVLGNIRPFLPRVSGPTITVFNTLSWRRSGTVMVYIDHQLLPRDRQFRITDAYNQPVPAQPLATREEGTWWMLDIKDVPPMGWLTCRIEVSDKPVATVESAGSGREEGNGEILENEFYRISLDREGRIAEFFDKEWNRPLSDPGAVYSPGQLIYERLGKNRGQLEQRRLDEYSRSVWQKVTAGPVKEGPVFRSVTLEGSLPGCAEGRITCEIRLYHGRKMVEFCYSMKKLPVTDPEGVYVAFPFALRNAKLTADATGGPFIAGKEQITGSASDWTGIQDFVSLRSDSGQVVFSSPEIPLVQLGDLNLGRFFRVNYVPPSPIGEGGQGEGAAGWKGSRYPASGHVYSWVLNNYWTTNFLASQEGELKWNYQITSGQDPSLATAAQFGREQRIPMICRVLPAAVDPDNRMAPKSFFSTMSGSIALVEARPAATSKGVIFHLRETAGKTDSLVVENLLLSSITFAMATGAKTIKEVNVLEEPVSPVWQKDRPPIREFHPVYIRFKPLETKFILIEK